MKFLKRLTFTVLVIGTIAFFCRGWLYSQVINYKSIGLRPTYSASNYKLKKHIDSFAAQHVNPDISQIIKLSLELTSKQLNFTASKNDNDPNKLINSRTAHCVGYASFFATTCNYLLDKYSLSDSWNAKPQIGQLYFLKTNVHKYLNSPFLKDHDFVTIENKVTGEVFAVDPTVFDYLGIDYVKRN